MAIDITGANTYFGATIHIRSEAWTRIPQARRIAAIVHATRLIESRLDDSLETDATVDGDFPRHDAAVYEQTLWMLELLDTSAAVRTLVLSTTNQGGTIASNVRAIPSASDIDRICLQALRFLVLNPRSVRFSRG
ncbi:MAG: hypothetical protein ABIJ53_02330 [Verrucomicrobiota bacterium]